MAFELKSNPAGASVYDGSNELVCGATPCPGYMPKGPGVVPGASVSLRFHRDGFRDKSAIFVVNQPATEVVLERLPAAAPVPMARPKPAESPAAPAKDFKDDPY